jgi:hypothetical protein
MLQQNFLILAEKEENKKVYSLLNNESPFVCHLSNCQYTFFWHEHGMKMPLVESL